jgi:hypothetical protein
LFHAPDAAGFAGSAGTFAASEQSKIGQHDGRGACKNNCTYVQSSPRFRQNAFHPVSFGSAEMTAYSDNHNTALRCPVGVVFVDGRVVCYDHDKAGELVARELGADAPVAISPAMRRIILADIEHQRAKRQEQPQPAC